ncbi:MAG: methylated-DNA--[protein]-cysteine S-methyltransferase [Legionella sp.]|nr:MAG: methylated-DNA--[protein]-cysteine S-methyltransferase [Legionella sp.]
MPSYYHSMPSPIGDLKLIASDQGLQAILWENDNPARVPNHSPQEKQNHPVLLEVAQQLKEYFAGQRQHFSLPLDFHGTEFQKKVWQALLTIPYGETRSYGQIAQQIGNPKSMRAVGAANGKNPISIITPCHRVIGANGQLVGFAGGLKIKSYLLELEAKNKKAS